GRAYGRARGRACGHTRGRACSRRPSWQIAAGERVRPGTDGAGRRAYAHGMTPRSSARRGTRISPAGPTTAEPWRTYLGAGSLPTIPDPEARVNDAVVQ